MHNLNNIPPIPQSLFAPHGEDQKTYDEYESLCKKLLEMFSFFFEYLGDSGHKKDAYALLKEAKDLKVNNLNGEEIRLSDDKVDIFGQAEKVRLQSFFASGRPYTRYTYDDRTSGDTHNCGIENGNIMLYFKDPKLIPYLIPTTHNYYTESINKSFLKNDTYDAPPSKPIYHKLHREIFTTQYFKKNLKLDDQLLDIDFSKYANLSDTKHRETIRSLNFCLKFLYSVCLIQSGLIDLYGPSTNKKEMYHYLKKNWDYPTGIKAKKISPYHLMFLSKLIEPIHMYGYNIAVALFRNKYGYRSKGGHGTWCIGRDENKMFFKDFLTEKIRHYIRIIIDQYNKADKNKQKELLGVANAAIALGTCFGIGYEVDQKVSKHYFYKNQVSLLPKEHPKAFEKLTNTTCNLSSPIFVTYYLYCREVLKDKITIRKLLGKNKGSLNNRLKKAPFLELLKISRKYTFAYSLHLSNSNFSVHKKIKLNIKKQFQDFKRFYNGFLHNITDDSG